MRGDRPSLTAELVTAVRALTHGGAGSHPAADDELAESLLSRPFRALLAGLRLFPRDAGFAAADLLSRGLARNVALRTLRIDDVVLEAVAAGARQLVILGAGLDARAYRLDELDDVTVFEVDHPSTQRSKRARLGAHRPTARDVAFVPVDFERDSLRAELERAGFHAGAESVWIWEGVTMYLTPDARRGTLATVAELSAPGSTLAATYVTGASIARWDRRVGQLAAGLIGERLRGMVSSEELRRELAEVGMSVIEDANGNDWAARYWADGTSEREWERLVVARRLAR